MPAMNIVFATHNDHKVLEARASLGPHYQVTSLSTLGWTAEIPETAETLIGNALLKARAVAERLGQACFADDTGLEIEALGGKPGVWTARFAGPRATALENREKTLRLMAGQENRKAVFTTVIVLIIDGQEHVFQGQVAGVITSREQGAEGFGYDPIFKPNGFEGTYAEIPLVTKARMSHRALAIGQLKEFLDHRARQSEAQS